MKLETTTGQGTRLLMRLLQTEEELDAQAFVQYLVRNIDQADAEGQKAQKEARETLEKARKDADALIEKRVRAIEVKLGIPAPERAGLAIGAIASASEAVRRGTGQMMPGRSDILTTAQIMNRNMDGVVDVLMPISGTTLPPGTVVTADMMGGAKRSQHATGLPNGVVVSNQPGYVQVRTKGTADVLLDSMRWVGKSATVYLSGHSAGLGSCGPALGVTSPIVIGQRMGSLVSGRVPVLVQPAYETGRRTRIWEHDAETYIDLELDTFVFAINGRRLAALDHEGLRIAGNLTTLPYTSETAQTAVDSRNGEIEYVEWETPDLHFISFAVLDGANWIRAMQLSSAGDLQVGAITTSAIYPRAKDAWPAYQYRYEWCQSGIGSLDFTQDAFSAVGRLCREEMGGVTNAALEVREITTDAAI